MPFHVVVEHPIVLQQRDHQADLHVWHGIHQFLRPALVNEDFLGGLVPRRQRRPKITLLPSCRIWFGSGLISSRSLTTSFSTCSGVNGFALRSAAISVMPGNVP